MRKQAFKVLMVLAVGVALLAPAIYLQAAGTDRQADTKVRKLLIMRKYAATNTSTAGTGISIKGYSGRATAHLMVEMDSNYTTNDLVTVAIQKCTASGGTGATTVTTFTTIPGTGSGQTKYAEQQIPLNLSGLGNYEYIRAVANITDASTTGTALVGVVLATGGARVEPVN